MNIFPREKRRRNRPLLRQHNEVYRRVLSRHSGIHDITARRISRVLSIIRADRSLAPSSLPADRRCTPCPLSVSTRGEADLAGHASRERNIAARSNGRGVNRDQEASKAGVNRPKDL